MYLADDPIQKFEDDELERKAFVDELTNSLLSRETNESLVLAFDGPWGSGKSSVLNLLESNIKENKQYQVEFIRFDPWYFNSTEHLLQTFFAELTRALYGKIKGKIISKKIKQYAKSLSSVQFSPKVSFGGMVEFSFGNVDVSLNNPDSLRLEIKKLVYTAKTRVLVLVDNLDRLDLQELLLVFKLVRLCSDFPGFSFVLAFDKQQVLKLLDAAKIPPDFLDKIIQVDIKLPLADQLKIDEFFVKGLDWIAEARKIDLGDFFWSRFFQIYRTIVGPKLITTLRDAKRLLNAVDFSLPIVKGEVDYADFIILQIIRVFFPDVYERLNQYKEALIKQDVIFAGSEWSRNEKIKIFGEFNSWIKETYGDKEKVINALLAFLFPNYRSYVQNPQNPSMAVYTKEYERYQMIASTAHFERYFTLRVSTSDIPTSLIMNFVERLNAQPDSTDIKEQFFQKYHESKNLYLALMKLDLYVDKLTTAANQRLIQALSENSLVFSQEDGPWESEIGAAITVLTHSLLALEPNVQVDVISKIISSAPSLGFSLRIAQDSKFGRWFSFDDETKKAILEVYRTRLHKDLLEGNKNLFELYPSGYAHIYGTWCNNYFLNEEEIAKNYLKSILDANPTYVIKILSMHVWDVVGSNRPDKFGYDDLVKRHDPNLIKGFLDKLNIESLSLSERDIYAIKEFNRIYSEKFPQAQ